MMYCPFENARKVLFDRYVTMNTCVNNCFSCSRADEEYIKILQDRIQKEDQLRELIKAKGKRKAMRYRELEDRVQNGMVL